jgi:hypothetical protein
VFPWLARVDEAADVGLLADPHAALVAIQTGGYERWAVRALPPRDHRGTGATQVPSGDEQIQKLGVALVAVAERREVQGDCLRADLDRGFGEAIQRSLPSRTMCEALQLRAEHGHHRQRDAVGAHPSCRAADCGDARGECRRVSSVGVEVGRDDCSGAAVDLELDYLGD